MSFHDDFLLYVRAMPQGEAQTALIMLGNFIANQHYVKPDIPDDLTPAAKAMIDRTCEACD